MHAKKHFHFHVFSFIAENAMVFTSHILVLVNMHDLALRLGLSIFALYTMVSFHHFRETVRDKASAAEVSVPHDR